jgi:hypothetical protein
MLEMGGSEGFVFLLLLAAFMLLSAAIAIWTSSTSSAGPLILLAVLSWL